MPAPSQEDSRDRRRRQNRESQRRWRERYRHSKPDDVKKPKGTLPDADETLDIKTPPMSDMQSRPQSRHLQQLLEPPDHSSYFDQQTWMQDHPAGQHDAHISWPAMDVNFDLHDGERCTSTLTQNNELSRESPINGYLNGVDKAPVQASSEFFVSPQVREQFSHFSSTGTCHPALLTPPTSSSSTSIGPAYEQSNFGGRCRETESASAAVETIRDVQLLYSIGVKAGFLKPDEKVKYYLAAMKRIYHKAPTLMDEDDEGLSGSEIDEWGDGALSDGGKLGLPPLQY
ncbi:hypothetical protein V491_01346 [Pseudogymnoascus sp. VKM F-3775]|nr:hypothetical protein V491_01346 [Pseudogymnoascus sp. VKM F-3775]